jgi:hypothetical protein
LKDGGDEPITTYKPPARLQLDTTNMEDGRHTLRIEAVEGNSPRGIKEVPFYVRNGPSITVEGLREGEVVEGNLSVLLHAYGGEGNGEFEPEKAETPAPVPTWAWVLIIIIFAWAMYYTIQYWNPGPEFEKTPTYQSESAGEKGSE